MDEAQALAMIAGGETYTVEFKGESREALSDHSVVKNVVCLANGQGGVLFIGVEDNGTVTGSRARHGANTQPGLLQAIIANQTQPPVSTRVTVLEIDGNEVITVEVPEMTTPVGSIRGEYVRRALDSRANPQCVPYLAHEMLGRIIDNRQQDFARLSIAGSSWDDLDPLEFERYRRMANSAGSAGDAVLVNLSDVDIALALGVAERDSDGNPEPLAGAILLFGRPESIARWIPTSEVLFQVFTGSNLAVDETWRKPLVATAEEVLQRLAPYNSATELEIGLQRIAIERLPRVVIREIIANALIHRDYTQNSPTVIQLRDATFEVTSPGGFPPGITTDNIISMTRPRSPLLSEAFKRVGLVERSGRGVKRVYEALLTGGLQGPDYSGSNRDIVRVVVPLVQGDLALARYFAEQSQSGNEFGLFELQVLYELKTAGPRTVSELVALTHETPFQVSAMMNRLVETGYVESRQSGKTTKFHLSSGVYRSLGDSSAYVRVHGFDNQQQEQMVLSFVRAHGQIARRDVAELCQMDSTGARRLLARMTAEGLLAIEGERRGAHYVLADPAQ